MENTYYMKYYIYTKTSQIIAMYYAFYQFNYKSNTFDLSLRCLNRIKKILIQFPFYFELTVINSFSPISIIRHNIFLFNFYFFIFFQKSIVISWRCVQIIFDAQIKLNNVPFSAIKLNNIENFQCFIKQIHIYIYIQQTVVRKCSKNLLIQMISITLQPQVLVKNKVIIQLVSPNQLYY